LFGKLVRKRLLGRPRRRWKDIRMGLREVGWEDVDWMHLTQDWDHWQVVVNINEFSGSIKEWEFLD
jgi:hypothetical protein